MPKEYRFSFIFYRKILNSVGLKRSCLFLTDHHMTLWSHHVTSHLTVRTCALQKSNWFERHNDSKKDWQR